MLGVRMLDHKKIRHQMYTLSVQQGAVEIWVILASLLYDMGKQWCVVHLYTKKLVLLQARRSL